jgi:O-antigen/teichoic acid export membrane protein
LIAVTSSTVKSRPAMQLFSHMAVLVSTFRLRPFDISTEAGRSKERVRRAALTTVASVFARAISLFVSLISVPLTFRYLGPERYGIWMVLVSIIAAMGFADLGIGNGLMNAISEAHGKDDPRLAREYISSALVFMLWISITLAFIGAIAYPFLPWQRLFNVKEGGVAAEGAMAFAVLYASFVLNIPLGVISRVQSGLQKGYVPQAIGALGSVLSLLTMLLVIWLKRGLPTLVFASVLGPIIATCVNGWLFFSEHRNLVPAFHAFRRESATKILKLGLLFFILQCTFAIAYSSDNIVIAQIMGAAAVAVYAVPQKLFSMVSMAIAMGILPLWPAYGEALARGDTTWVRRAFQGSLWLTLGITVPVSIVLALAGPDIIRVAVSRSFHASTSLYVLLAVWAVVNSVSMVTATLLSGTGVLKTLTIAAVIASAANLAFSIVLTRKFGVVGVCAGSIISQLVITLPVTVLVIRGLFRRLDAAKCASPPGDASSPSLSADSAA